MTNNTAILDISKERHPFLSVVILFFLVFAGLYAGYIVGLIIIKFATDIDVISSLDKGSQDFLMNDQYGKLPVFIFQAMSSISGFIIAPLFYLYFFEKETFKVFSKHANNKYVYFLCTLLIVLIFMPFNSIIIEWNEQLIFPDFLETQLRAWEGDAEKLTKYITTFNSTNEFVWGLVIIAFLPAITEELLFRGFFQNLIHKGVGNHHIAIWLTGFLFSAIHMQFYGIIPRMLLGVIFGYLYFWSGNLFVAMFAHLVNNGFSIIMVYLHQLGHIDFDIENTEASSSTVGLICLIAVLGLMYIFNRISSGQSLKHE